MEKARVRKEHMITMDENSKKLQISDGVRNLDADKDLIRRQAQETIDKDENISKLLNTCSQRAAAFAVRDKQLKDKKEREKQEREYERIMDISMEVDRLKEISRREEEENAKIRKRVSDRKVIEQQIEERRLQRLLAEKNKDVENKNMLELIKKRKAEEEELEKKRKEEAQALRLDTLKMNEEAVKQKLAMKEIEKEEEEIILAFQAQRDEDMRKREEFEKEEERRKKEIQMKLLVTQAKNIDKQAQIDELKARRAAEDAEKKQRAKELAAAKERKRNMQILLEARKVQEREKAQLKKCEMHEREEEFLNTLKTASDMAKREQEEAELTKKRSTEFRKLLLQQINKNEQKKSTKESEKFKEGEQIKEKIVRFVGDKIFFAQFLRSNECLTQLI